MPSAIGCAHSRSCWYDYQVDLVWTPAECPPTRDENADMQILTPNIVSTRSHPRYMPLVDATNEAEKK